jgi:histidine ammonia-lyase
VVAAALTAAGRPDAPFFAPQVHRLYRQRGQADVAATFRALLARDHGPAAAASHEAHRLGACLDLLRQAGGTLERAANSVTEDRLVLWQSEEMIDGVEDLSSLAAASDLMALALTTLVMLSETRVAALADVGRSADPEVEGLSAKAGSFVAENRARAEPSGLDPEGLKRLLPMAGTTALVVAIELLEALRTAPESGGEAVDRLGDVRQLVKDAAPPMRETGAVAAGNLASVAVLVGSGALTVAAAVDLPEVAPRQPPRPAFRLGVRRKAT